MRVILLVSLLTAVVTAQTVVDIPQTPSPQNLDRPFPGGVGRYQQWYSPSAAEWAPITEPMRFQQIEFLAGTNNSAAPQPLTVNCEILMGHGKFSFFGNFDGNWDEPPTLVVPLSTIQITASAPGTPCMTIPFATRFTWDRVRPIVVEVRIYGNNQGNQPFLFRYAGTTQAIATTRRNYAAGNALASSGQVQQGVGLLTRFEARPGAMLEYGAGCPAQGNIIPQNSAAQIASPGITWTHDLTNAPSQRPAFWVLGDTRDAPYPLDLGMLLGAGPGPCDLLTNPVFVLGATTIGGGAGAGAAQVNVNLPATTGYVGVSIFSQWVVFDPLSLTGIVAVTPGIWTIVAPVGG